MTISLKGISRAHSLQDLALKEDQVDLDQACPISTLLGVALPTCWAACHASFTGMNHDPHSDHMWHRCPPALPRLMGTLGQGQEVEAGGGRGSPKTLAASEAGEMKGSPQTTN